MSAVTTHTPHDDAHAHEVPYKTQMRSNRLGLWLFMFSELFLFGALFTTRFIFSKTLAALSQEIGLLATAILLLSSFMYRCKIGTANGSQKTFLRSSPSGGPDGNHIFHHGRRDGVERFRIER